MSGTVLDAEHIMIKIVTVIALMVLESLEYARIRNRSPERLNLTFFKSKVSKMLLFFGSISKHLKIYPKEITMNVYKVLAISYPEELREPKRPKGN